MPQNSGDSGKISNLKGLKVIKVFELELSNMEGSPSYGLTHQLSIGSEIGNIVVADPSVSPRHASFILQEEVISVIDHGSVAGTFINGNKIPAGKYIILEESDVVAVGDLEVRIKTHNQSVPADEIPELPEEDEIEEVASEEELDEEVEEVEGEEDDSEEDEIEEKPMVKPAARNKKKPALVSFNSTSIEASNALVRVVAVISDLLLSYVILTVFLPFDDFRNFLEFVPAQFGELLGVQWSDFWKAIVEEHQVLATMLEDVYEVFAGSLQLGPLLMTFILLRMVSTLIFGVSVSERLLSVQAGGNKIWGRIGGVFRVIVGVFTWPFIVFDVPAIVSRRTFKEFITFTYIFTSSKFLAILGTIFLIPLFLGMALVAPLFQGFEPPMPIMVNDKIEQRVKVVKPAEDNGAEVTEEKKSVASSAFLGVQLAYHPEEFSVFPELKFRGVGKKLNFRSQLVFFDHELQKPVRLELMKHFDLQQLLGLGIKGNYFLRERYPELAAFVYQPEGVPFKAPKDARANNAFASEFIGFTKFALELSLENALEEMQNTTPLLKGPVDFKEAFLNLLEYKDLDQIGFIKIGNLTFLKVSYPGRRPFDLLIPLAKGQGRVFQVEFDSKENLEAAKSKFYKYALEKADWLHTAPNRTNTDAMNAFQVIDTFTAIKPENKSLSLDQAQALYGFYFEKSAEVLKRANQVETDLWKKALASAEQLINNLDSRTELAEGEEDPSSKLKQNFRDLKEAVENSNLEYLGIPESTTI